MAAAAGKDSASRAPSEPAARVQTPLERWSFERLLARGSSRLVRGVDEAGRGPLAGPVVAAAVILDPAALLTDAVTDSKLLDLTGRLLAMREISPAAVAIAWRAISPKEIDRVNIRQASFLAMRGAVAGLPFLPDVVVTDGEPCPGMPVRTEGFPRADFLVPAVAAASIVAKLVRDAIMADMARFHPVYGFDHNRGYPTPGHLGALREHGPCREHRMTYAPVRARLEMPLFELESLAPAPLPALPPQEVTAECRSGSSNTKGISARTTAGRRKISRSRT